MYVIDLYVDIAFLSNLKILLNYINSDMVLQHRMCIAFHCWERKRNHNQQVSIEYVHWCHVRSNQA